MADIASTILRGTDQMAEAAQGLVRVRAAKRERKAAALRAVGDSLREAGATIKQYGDWKSAKQAEDEVKTIDESYGLGLATKGHQGGLVALQAIRPTTAQGARRVAALADASQDGLAKQNGIALQAAQMHHLEQLDKEAEDKRTQDAAERVARKTVLAKYPLAAAADPEEAEAHDLFAAGGITSKDYVSFREQKRKEREFDAKQKSDAAKEAMKEAGRNARTKTNRASIEGVALADRVSREGVAASAVKSREGIVKSQLDAAKTNAENAAAAHARSDALRDGWEQQKLDVLRDEQARGWTKMRLDAKVKQLTLDRLTALSKGWNSDEDKADLLASIDAEKGAVDGIIDDIKTFEAAAPRAAPAAAPKTLEQHSDADLINIITGGGGGK